MFTVVGQETLRGGLIGCGFFGQIQLEAWRRMDGSEIVAACDCDLAKAGEAAASAYQNAEQMLEREQLDFVDIATRPDTHLTLVKLCVERGLPVIVQKPMAPGMNEAVEMVRVTESSGVPVMVHENWRWQPWHREMKRRVEAGDIGAPFGYHFTMMNNDGLGPRPYPNQPYFSSMPKLMMYESLVHPVDLARFYFGEVEKVFAIARRRNPSIAGEDRAVMILSHRASVDGVVEGQRYLQPEPPGPAMGHSVIEGEEGRMMVLASGELLLNGRMVWRNRDELGYKGDSVKATQEHFIDCLRRRVEFETSARRYLGSFAAVEAAYQSVREERAIRL
jgi:predicted dehydrogenase